MVKWEYMIADIKIPESAREDFVVQTLNQYGAAGWEACFWNWAEVWTLQVVFKRRVES